MWSHAVARVVVVLDVPSAVVGVVLDELVGTRTVDDVVVTIVVVEDGDVLVGTPVHRYTGAARRRRRGGRGRRRQAGRELGGVARCEVGRRRRQRRRCE